MVVVALAGSKGACMGTAGILSAFAARSARLAHSAPDGARRLAGSLSITLIGQGLTLVGLVLITRLSVHAFGATGFGEYQVARRTLAVIAFPLMCGLGVSVPRFIARDIVDPKRVAAWLLAAMCLAVILIAGFLGFGTIFSSSISRSTFGLNSKPLVLSLLLAAAGMFLSTMAIAALRGLSRFHGAATLQVLNSVIVPMIAIFFAYGRVERALIATGAGWAGISCVVMGRLYREWVNIHIPVSKIRAAMGALCVFGLPRVPGEVALFGLFALPGYAAVHRGNIVGAGYLSVGLSLIQAIATAFASTGFVLLPYWSRAASTSAGMLTARKRMGWLVIASAALAAAGTIALEAILPAVAHLLLGPLAQNGLHDIRYVLLGTIPYVVYLVLRDYFDAISVFPLNTLALCAAILLQAAFLKMTWFGVPLATAMSFLALGAIMVTFWIVSHRFQHRAAYPNVGQAAEQT